MTTRDVRRLVMLGFVGAINLQVVIEVIGIGSEAAAAPVIGAAPCRFPRWHGAAFCVWAGARRESSATNSPDCGVRSRGAPGPCHEWQLE